MSPGPEPSLAWIEVKRCAVDPRYQRTLESRRSQEIIDRIASDFRWSCFQAVLATMDGKGGFLLLDGQHRVEAARRCGIAKVPAVVVDAGSIAEQAAAFVRANLDRVAVNTFALHHAKIVAGDATHQEIDRACRAAGVSIPRYPIPADKLEPGQTLALATIRSLLIAIGSGPAAAVLRAVSEGLSGRFLRAPLIKAAAQLFAQGSTPAEREATLRRVRDWLKRTEPADLFAKALRRKASYGGTEADNIAALMKGGVNAAQRTASPAGASGIKGPTREQLMGRR